MAQEKPPGAVHRDPSRKLSSWLKTRRLDQPSTPACKTCKGTGTSGWKDALMRTITCTTCGGFGF